MEWTFANIVYHGVLCACETGDMNDPMCIIRCFIRDPRGTKRTTAQVFKSISALAKKTLALHIAESDLSTFDKIDAFSLFDPKWLCGILPQLCEVFVMGRSFDSYCEDTCASKITLQECKRMMCIHVFTNAITNAQMKYTHGTCSEPCCETNELANRAKTIILRCCK